MVDPHMSAGRAPVPVVAGIDIATAAVRVVCVDAAGTLRAEGRAALPAPRRWPDGRSEQDALAWWDGTVRALRQATGALPGRGREVAGVAIAATSGTVVLADAAGQPIGPGLMYDDRRAAELNARAQEVGRQRWQQLGLTVSPTAALGRVAWYAAQPDARRRGSRLLHTPDLVASRLVSAPVATDHSHALKTGYDPRAGQWATEVFDALDVDPSWLPPVDPPGSAAGTVSAAAAEQTGLPAGCSVRLGMTDGCAGQLACGAVHPGQFVGVLGTTYVLKGVTRELVLDPDPDTGRGHFHGALYSHRHPDGHWLPGGASNTGGEALAEVSTGQLAELDAAAARRGPARQVRYPLRRDGERFPFVHGQARGFTLGAAADQAEEHRATLEGVAFLERLALERVRALGVPVHEPLSAAGGGSNSALWTRIRATVSSVSLRVAEQAETGYGAALLAATGTLHGSLDEAAEAMVPSGRLVRPDAAETAAMEESYQRFVAELDRRGWLG